MYVRAKSQFTDRRPKEPRYISTPKSQFKDGPHKDAVNRSCTERCN
jgi:hypothetical protein